jgi:hypothetical protein
MDLLAGLLAPADAPFSLRFLVQPLLAVLLGARDGWRDGKEGRPPYVWSLLRGNLPRPQLLREAWKAVSGPLFVAVALDLLVQALVMPPARPWHAVAVGGVLVALPYVLARGSGCRAWTWRGGRQA